MNYLLVAATPKEIDLFINHYDNNGINANVDILITGIGLTATTYALTKQCQLKRPDVIIQAGVAGGLDKKMKLGDVVVVKSEALADQSVMELNSLKTLFDLKLVPQNKPPFNKGWLVNPHRELLKSSGLKAVKGISVNEITTSPQKIKFYGKMFDAAVESMEGAALHYVCLMEKIPFIQFRSISNYVGERNKSKWNMKESIINLNEKLIEFFQKLPMS